MSFAFTEVDTDVIIIGAGIAGICFAHRLQEGCPKFRYEILEQRHELGGTWSLFKYPGIRCDSDLYTYGFPWAPWDQPEALAGGAKILQYIRQTAEKDGVFEQTKFNQNVISMDWSSKTQTWTVSVRVQDGSIQKRRSKFVFLATGYFDYSQPLQAQIPGIQSFEGDVIHPQFWPDNYDHTEKSIVVIGSGATAITLLPAMAQRAKHVTILQRSPSYIMSIPAEDRTERVIRAVAPRGIATKLIRLKWIVMPAIFRTICTRFPSYAKNMMRKLTQSQLKEGESVDTNFAPAYSPFEQRMCMCPNGDFYEALRSDKASIKTGMIDTITSNGIRLQSGEELHPDTIVTATGLKLQLGGNIKITVDGNQHHIPDLFVWKGIMFENIPNLFFSFGYLDTSWTLGVDTSAQLACKLLNETRRKHIGAIVPRRNEHEKSYMQELKFMPLTSTYVEKAMTNLPRVGNSAPWRPRASYLWEQVTLRFGNSRDGLEWVADAP